MIFSIIVSDCPNEKTFKTYFGELKNLKELKNELAQKGDDFYYTYVTQQENHFANWVEHVFQDNVLANELRKAKNSKEAIEKLENRLLYAELWLKYNKEKEDLVTNAIKMYNSKVDFEPEHHKFETLQQLNLLDENLLSVVKNFSLDDIENNSVTKKLLPPLPPLLPFNLDEDYNPEEVMKNSIKLENKTTIKHKKDEQEILAKELEKHFPGVKIVNEQKKGFFEKIIGFLR